jgi:helicase MOV-10
MPLPPSFCRYIIVGECPWGDGCKFRHDIVGCSCGLAIQLEHLRAHTRGNRHRRLLAELQARKEMEGLEDGVVPVSFLPSLPHELNVRLTECL